VTGREDVLPPKRRWLAIMLATFVELFSYWLMLFADLATQVDADVVNPPESGAGAFFLGLGLMPFAFIVLAFGSKHRNAPGAVAKAMIVSLLFGLALALFALPVGLVAGFGAGGVFALRLDEPHRPRLRWTMVAGATLYMFVVLLISPEAGLFAGGFLPFAAVGFADMLAEYQEERAQGE
jgi:hypothetical protein